MHLVSCILLTTHPKRAKYLPDAVKSFRAQTHPDKELVVINDGEPLRSNAPDIRVVNLPPRGTRYTIGEKRNAGIRMAHGEWLATWDDDDVSLPNRLEEQLRAAEESGADIVLPDRTFVSFEDMKVTGACTSNSLVHAAVMIRRDHAVRSGGYLVQDWAEDQSFFHRCKLRCRSVVFVMPDCDWYVHRRHAANITNQFGDSVDNWIACAAKEKAAAHVQRLVDQIRSSPGEGLIVSAP